MIKENILNINSVMAFLKGREIVCNAFATEISSLSATKSKKSIESWVSEGTGIKTLTPKQMLVRLLIALSQVKLGYTSEKLLNEILKIVYSLYRAKEITRKVYNNKMNLI